MADERLDSEKRQSLMGKIDAGVRSAANFLTFGYADKFDAYMASKTGIGGKKDAYEENLAKNEAINALDNEVNREAVVTGKVAGAAIGLSGLATRGLVSAGARSLGQTTGATIAAPGNIARAVVQAPSTIASAAKAAPNNIVQAVSQTSATVVHAAKAAPSVSMNAARATKNAIQNPSIIAEAAKTGAKGGAKLIMGGVKFIINKLQKPAAGIVSSATAIGVTLAVDSLVDDGKNENDPSKVLDVNDSKLLSGGLTIGTGYALLKLGERVVAGRFKPLITVSEKLAGSFVGRAVAGTGQAVWQGATKQAVAFGTMVATGELAAAAYARDLASGDPTLLSRAIYNPLNTHSEISRAIKTKDMLLESELFDEMSLPEKYKISDETMMMKNLGDIAISISEFGAKTQVLGALAERTDKYVSVTDPERNPKAVVYKEYSNLLAHQLEEETNRAKAEIATALPDAKTPEAFVEPKVKPHFNQQATAKPHHAPKQHKAAPTKIAKETVAPPATPVAESVAEKLPVIEITENQVTTVETPEVIEMTKLAESLKDGNEKPTVMALNTVAPPINKADLS